MCTPNSGVIYSRYCSYSSLIHNDVLLTTRHVSKERKLFDVGEIFFFYYQRRNKTLGTNVCLIDLSLLTKGGFCQLRQNDPRHRSIFYALSENHVRVNNFLKAVQVVTSLGTLRVKVENSI